MIMHMESSTKYSRNEGTNKQITMDYEFNRLSISIFKTNLHDEWLSWENVST